MADVWKSATHAHASGAATTHQTHHTHVGDATDAVRDAFLDKQLETVSWRNMKDDAPVILLYPLDEETKTYLTDNIAASVYPVATRDDLLYVANAVVKCSGTNRFGSIDTRKYRAEMQESKLTVHHREQGKTATMFFDSKVKPVFASPRQVSFADQAPHNMLMLGVKNAKLN